MSSTNDELQKVLDQQEMHKTDRDRKRDELVKKKEAVEEFRIKSQYENVIRANEQAKQLEEISLDVDATEYTNEIVSRNTDYLLNARKSNIFLSKKMTELVPYFPKNLILLGARSGQGKSTIASNLAFNALRNGQRPLIITNEEAEEDFYNRLSCLFKGIHYTNHSDFTDADLEYFNKMITGLSQKMMVISDVWRDEAGRTTTLEGMIGLFEGIKKSKKNFDVIIVDYYQGISSSVRDPGLADWQCQQEFATYLNSFIKAYPHAPVILLSQLKEGEDTFKNRIEGRKVVFNRATCVVEVKPNFDLHCTEFLFHKARHNQAVGKHVKMGYDKGKFVEYNDEFVMRVQMEKQRQMTLSTLKEVGENKDGGSGHDSSNQEN